MLTKPIKDMGDTEHFLDQIGDKLFFSYHDQIYSCQTDNMGVIDIDTKMPGNVRWLCQLWQWQEYKKLLTEMEIIFYKKKG
jgi:hypothetical protein